VLTTIRKGFPHCSAHGRCVVLDYQGPEIVISEIDPLRGKGPDLAKIRETFGGYLLPDGNAFAVIVTVPETAPLAGPVTDTVGGVVSTGPPPPPPEAACLYR